MYQQRKTEKSKNTVKKLHEGRIIPATEDWCGKELFENKEVREGFLSDILKIPRTAIKETYIMNPSLWKRERRDKQGILDIKILMNNDKVINIEIQVIRYDRWDRRQLFYLSKMYAEMARRGEEYDNLPDCISIAILDFNITDEEEYFHCYKLRDEKGRVFSEAISIYILELKKKLGKEAVLDDWIRLFRAKTEEDLNMITSKNNGIKQAIKELRILGLTGIIREEYEYRLKAKRDAKARESYVRKEGIAIGKQEGIIIGKQDDILELLADLGEIPGEVRKTIRDQYDLEVLREWHKLAAKSETMEEFKKSFLV